MKPPESKKKGGLSKTTREKEGGIMAKAVLKRNAFTLSITNQGDVKRNLRKK